MRARLPDGEVSTGRRRPTRLVLLRRGLIIVAATLGAGLTYVAAQGASEADANAAPAVEDGDEALPVVTTPEEQVAQSEAIFATGTSIRDRVQGMLTDARRDRDVIRITCLEDKLTQIRAHIASAEARHGELRAAVEANDGASREHQYTTIRVLATKLRDLSREAAQCVGQDVFEVPEATVSGEGPDEIEDPTVLPTTPAPDVPYIPPPASGVF
jgi:hypothetical protein